MSTVTTDNKKVLTEIESPVEIFPSAGVFIGALAHASNADFLRRHGINFVLNLSGFPNKVPLGIENVNYVLYDQELMDTEIKRVCDKFETAAKFIFDARSAGKTVLVHCLTGINRATTVIGYYLGRYCTYSSCQILTKITELEATCGLKLLLNQSFKKILHPYRMAQSDSRTIKCNCWKPVIVEYRTDDSYGTKEN